MGESANNRQFSRVGRNDQPSPLANDPGQVARPLVAFLLGVLLQILQEPSTQRARVLVGNRLSAPALLTPHSGLTPLLATHSGNGYGTEVCSQDEGQGDVEARSALQGNTHTESGVGDKWTRQGLLLEQLELPRLRVLRQDSVQSSKPRTSTEVGQDTEGPCSLRVPRRYSAPSPRLAYEQPSVSPEQHEESSLSSPSSPLEEEPLDDYLFRAFIKWMRRRRASRHVSATPVRERSLLRSSSTSASPAEKQRAFGPRTPSISRYFEGAPEAAAKDYSRTPARTRVTTERRSERAVESSSDSDTPMSSRYGDYAFQSDVNGKYNMHHGRRVSSHSKDGRPRSVRWSVSAPSSSQRSHGYIATPEDEWPSSDDEPPPLMPRLFSGQRASHVRSSTAHPRGERADHSGYSIGPDHSSHPLASVFQQNNEPGKSFQSLRATDNYTQVHPGGVHPVQMTFQFYNQSTSGAAETGSSRLLLPPNGQGGTLPKRPLASATDSEGFSPSKGSRRIPRRELPQYSHTSPSMKSTTHLPVQECGAYGAERGDELKQAHTISPEFASPQPKDPASKHVAGLSSVRPMSAYEGGGASAPRLQRTSYSAPSVGSRQASSLPGKTGTKDTSTPKSRIPVLHRSDTNKRMCMLLLDSAPHTLKSQPSAHSLAGGWRGEVSDSTANGAAVKKVQSRATVSPDEQQSAGPGSAATRVAGSTSVAGTGYHPSTQPYPASLPGPQSRHTYTWEALYSRPPLSPHRPRPNMTEESLSDVHSLRSRGGESYPSYPLQTGTTSRPAGRRLSPPRESSWPEDTGALTEEQRRMFASYSPSRMSKTSRAEAVTPLRVSAFSRPRPRPIEDEYMS